MTDSKLCYRVPASWKDAELRNAEAMAAKATRILLVDDDPSLQRLLRRWLELEGCTLETAQDGRQAIAAIQENPPQLLITDWEMPEFDGLALCRWLRQQAIPNYVYTIFLTSRSASQDIVTALESGADDFIRKPVDRGELIARVRAGNRVLELESRLSRLACTDPLTGLVTRRTFFEQVEREWGRAQRHGFPISCVMLDIDFFKRINDSYGHRAGDHTLLGVAQVLQENCRETDVVGRYGGEEFCVLLPETDETEASAWAERVRQKIASSSEFAGNAKIQVTASFGVAQKLADTSSPEHLVDLADQALLLAKRSGRDRVVAFNTIASAETIHAARNSLVDVFRDLAAKDVMANIVAGLGQDDTVGTAVNYFLRFRYYSAPVVDDQGKLVGVLSERDVMGVMLGPNWWTAKIRNVMKKNAVCYDEATPVLTVYEFLSRVSIRGVVIVKDGRPTGTISRASLLRWVANMLAVCSRSPILANVASDPVHTDLGIKSPDPRTKINLLAEGVVRETDGLAEYLRTQSAEIVPGIVGGVSRIEDMLSEILSLTRNLQSTIPLRSASGLPTSLSTRLPLASDQLHPVDSLVVGDR